MKPAKRFKAISDPTVLQVLKLTQQPDIISFAGGTPAPQTFAVKLIKNAQQNLKQEDLQYSPAPGTPAMRQAVADWLTPKLGYQLKPENVLITTGSQQALDLIARTYLNPQDQILLRDPTYFVALYAFNAYEPRYKTIDPKNLPSSSSAKLAYLIPTFQNPTGTTMNHPTREEVAKFVENNQLLLIEDDPYSHLYFDNPSPKPIHSHISNHSLYLTTLSKIVGPAMRLGIIIGPKDIIHQLGLVKTGMDLCTSGYLQTIAAAILTNDKFETHLDTTRHYYASQKTTMIQALETHMPEDVSWTNPSGGLFIWLTLPKQVDSKSLYQTAIENKVAIVPGYIFSPNQTPSNQLRLSYAAPTKEQIDTGIKQLSQVIKKALLQ